MPGLQAFRKKFNSPFNVTSKDGGSAMGVEELWVDGAGFGGMLGPFSLHPPAHGDPLPCAHGLLLGEGKPVVDHLERRQELSGWGW